MEARGIEFHQPTEIIVTNRRYPLRGQAVSTPFVPHPAVVPTPRDEELQHNSSTLMQETRARHIPFVGG
jgi:hypothetical protein